MCLKIFLHLFMFALSWTIIKADCQIQISGNRPILKKSFGSRKIFLDHSPQTITLQNGETLTAYCSSRINLIGNNHYEDFSSRLNNARSLMLTCNEEKASYGIPPDFINTRTSYKNFQLSCDSPSKQSVFESSEILPKCENYMSYAIGLKSDDHSFITAGLCYDVEHFSLKYAVFPAYKSQYEFEQTRNLTFNLNVNLNQKLGYLDTYFKFLSENSFRSAYNLKKQNNNFLKLFDFEVSSLIQDDAMQISLKDVSYMLNIVWWQNLRLGNWRLYLNALRDRTVFMKYTIYTGTSGVVTIPSSSKSNKCIENEVLEIAIENKKEKVPEYIWSYLKAADGNDSEEIVIIGYNSPFYEEGKETIFCEDICNEISWLKDTPFNKAHLMPSMGLVFCCRPEEVANKFYDFPKTRSNLMNLLKQIVTEKINLSSENQLQ